MCRQPQESDSSRSVYAGLFFLVSTALMFAVDRECDMPDEIPTRRDPLGCVFGDVPSLKNHISL